MRNTNRRGGVLMASLVGLLLLAAAIVVGIVVVASTIRVHQEDSADGGRFRIETPMGDMKIDARDNLRPETVGVPIYPGAVRERDNGGGLTFDFDGNDNERKRLSFVAAAYSTTDSAEQVREFYRSRLPHWIFTRHSDHDMHIEYSQGGYKRVVAIDERKGQTHIGIASVGEPGVN